MSNRCTGWLCLQTLKCEGPVPLPAAPIDVATSDCDKISSMLLQVPVNPLQGMQDGGS